VSLSLSRVRVGEVWPRINLIIYHGVLAPNARVRAAVVTFGTPGAVTPAAAPTARGTG
jgi:hypothetical protein